MKHFLIFEDFSNHIAIDGINPEKMWVEIEFNKGFNYRLYLGGSVVGNLWLDGEIEYKGECFIEVKIVNIHSMIRGNGYSYLLYKTALQNLQGFAGICSKMSHWSNKKQVPKIYKRLGATPVRFPDEDGIMSSYRLLRKQSLYV